MFMTIWVITVIVAFFAWYVVHFEKDKFGKYPECVGVKDRCEHSFCMIWVAVDLSIYLLSILFIGLEYSVGELNYQKDARSRVLFAHFHAHSQFMDDSDFKDKKKYAFNLTKQLENSLIKDLKEEDPSNADNKETELSEAERQFKLSLEYAKKRLPMTKDEVIDTLDKSIEALSRDEDPRPLVRFVSLRSGHDFDYKINQETEVKRTISDMK